MCIIALTPTRSSVASSRARAYIRSTVLAHRSIINVSWDWNVFTIRDSTRSNSISQGNKLLDGRTHAGVEQAREIFDIAVERRYSIAVVVHAVVPPYTTAGIHTTRCEKSRREAKLYERRIERDRRTH